MPHWYCYSFVTLSGPRNGGPGANLNPIRGYIATFYPAPQALRVDHPFGRLHRPLAALAQLSEPPAVLKWLSTCVTKVNAAIDHLAPCKCLTVGHLPFAEHLYEVKNHIMNESAPAALA